MSDRVNFGRLHDVLPIPDLIEIQTKSYDDFLQPNVAPDKRECKGLQEVLKDAFSQDNSEGAVGLEFLNYEIEQPKVPMVDCLKDGGTYQGCLYGNFRFRLPNQKEAKEERIFLGELPIMSERGSFVINGAERVIVSQLHRSPGVCFEKMKHASGKDIFSYKIVADHGSWLEVQYDNNDYMWIYLDRKRRRRKFLISTFLRAFGFQSDRELLDAVYRCYFLSESAQRVVKDKFGRSRLSYMFTEPSGNPSDKEIALFQTGSAEADKRPGEIIPHWLGVKDVPIEELLAMDPNDLTRIYTAEEIVDPADSKRILIDKLTSLSQRDLDAANDAGVATIAAVDTIGMGDTFINCVIKEHKEGFNINTPEEARKDIYRKLRPQDTATEANSRMLFVHQFEDARRYDLGRVGRYRLFKRLFHAPLADFDYLMSDDEKQNRERTGKITFDELKKALAFFQELLAEFNDDVNALDEDQHILRMMFASPEAGLSELFRPAAVACDNAELATAELSAFVKDNLRKFLAEVALEDAAVSYGGVLGEFLQINLENAEETIKKACARIGIGPMKSAAKSAREEETIRKTISDIFDQLSGYSKEDFRTFVQNEDKAATGKKDAKQKLTAQIMPVVHLFINEIIKEFVAQVQDFLKTRRYLTKADIAFATAYLMRLKNDACYVDDIDHLGRRRVRTIGELLQNQCRVGLARMITTYREKVKGPDSQNTNFETTSISRLLNTRPLAGVIRDFFGRNQLSQFMDQTNALAELTNKRRLSALGPGGLTRERAGFEVRDVHSSHYGRVCPIETPEGPNIGLISSLALYAKIDEFGFINTPYRHVENCIVSNDVEYLAADREEEFYIAQANAPQDANGKFINQEVWARHAGDANLFPREKANFIDVSPRQLISAATGLIPFLEHDDANRALMGSNMQRQAVPLLHAERPFVGTGLEEPVARFSRAVMSARADGIVASSNAERIIVTADGKMPEETAFPESVQEYKLYKFLRSNASTLVNQHPIVKRGQKVVKDQAIADGACTDQGELALGRNVTVAFMSWHGYNFEDAIIISEKLVSNDVYTSIHVSLEDVIARDTKLGPEEITRDIPNVAEEALRNLDAEGVVRIGAEVKPGDVLVGKTTPKSEEDLAPEERLLRAVFGDKAAEVKDTSLQVPGGLSGIVMDVRLDRKVEPGKSNQGGAESLKTKIHEAEVHYNQERDTIIDDMVSQLGDEFLGKKMEHQITRIVADEPEELIAADRKITKGMLNRLAQNYDGYQMRECEQKAKIEEIVKPFRAKLRDNEQCRKEAIALIEKGEGRDLGKIRSVKVYIASKRKISVGDKMAGRHGNKGIVAKIVPVEDMPFMADGTPVDIILNPLGVPSRMNIGQVFETHVGWAAKILGMTVATPVFDGIHEDKILDMLKQAREIKVKEQGWTIDSEGHVRDQVGRNRDENFVGLDGKIRLFDGRTGDPFAQKIMVGQIYMLKLDHLVANKIHARAVGTYSLVTQQPLGGKAQHGGQRFGEMEVWALEAYGAAYTLQEMLTVKSDDVVGRTKMYDSIMRGDDALRANMPESFNVLQKEMKSLCLDIRLCPGKGSEI